MLKILFITFIVIIILRSLVAFFWLLFILAWLKIKSKKQTTTNNHNHRFILLIPVLKEQKILLGTVNHLLKLYYPKDLFQIVFITTEKEYQETKLDKKNTIDLVKEIKKQQNEKHQTEIIEHLHYPYSNGKMVDQLNYAFEHILKNKNLNPNNTFVGIYNADSKPHLNTLNTICQQNLKTNNRIYQQSAIFFDNFNQFNLNNNLVLEKFLKTNALIHTRWTLVHEIPRLLRQSFFINKYNKRFFLSHCVGHGLFMRLDFLNEIQQMPHKTLTEDLFFGYILSLLGEPINPIPVMESAEMPNTFTMSLKQKFVWFFGPLDHLSYKKYFSNNYKNKASNSLINWITFQGLLPALAWITSGFIFLYTFIYPIATHNYQLLTIAILSYIFYSPLIYIIILSNYKFLNNLCSKKDRLNKSDFIWTSFFSLPANIIHSIPPVFSVYAKIKSIITKIQPNKPKTER